MIEESGARLEENNVRRVPIAAVRTILKKRRKKYEFKPIDL
jgi:hypothetical protein